MAEVRPAPRHPLLTGLRPRRVDGRRWSTIEGTAEVRGDAADVAEAVRRYTQRYRVPRENPRRVALRIEITRVLGNL